MALAPRSSLRALVLLMSHGKPRLCSFFSSSAPPSGNCNLAAPAVEPPEAPDLPDMSSHNSPLTLENREHPMPDYGSHSRKLGDGVVHPIHDPPTRTGDDHVPHYPVPLLWAVDEDPKHQTPDGGLYSSTPEPVPSPEKAWA